MTTRSRWLIFLVSTPLVALIAVGGLLGATGAVDQQSFPQLRAFRDVVGLVMGAYVEEVDVDRVMDGAMRGLADGLDGSSAFLTPDEVRDIETGAPPPRGGIGVVVTRQFYLRVVGVRDESPAALAGLRPGDYIRAIDDVPTRAMSAVTGTRRLRGEPGTTVKLLIIRGNAADPHEVEVERAPAAGETVRTTALPGGFTHVRVASFDAATAEDLRAVFLELEANGSAGAVIDIRGTADGLPAHGVEAARLFVERGTLATLAGRTDEPQVTEADAFAGDGAITMPVVLLASNGTANAAEVFAAALAGNDRAELVGEPTAGIAAVQRLVPLPERHGFWMTYARYLTTEGDPIHGQGLTPDVGAAQPFVEFGEAPPTEDAPLAAAVGRLEAAIGRPAA